MRIKIYTHRVKINFQDDLPKVSEYFAKQKVDLSFEAPLETNIVLKDLPIKLYLPNDDKKTLKRIMYIFDRYTFNEPKSSCINFSTTLMGLQISTAKHDDAVNYTWALIAHEIMHTFFYELKNLGIAIEDPMDTYIHNDDPYHPNGNFAEAWKRLAPYMHLLFPKWNYFKDTEPTGGGHTFSELDFELKELLDTARGISNTPYRLTSGYRTPQENANVGGKPNSAHIQRLAVDIFYDTSTKLFAILKGLINCGKPVFIEIAKRHVHVDIYFKYHAPNSCIIEPNDD